MMRLLETIARHVTVLNVLLTVAVMLAGTGIVFPLARMDYRYKLPRIAQQVAPAEEKPVEDSPAALPTDYAVVGEMNLFHPERITPIDKKAELPKPELILYGTIVDDKQQVAFIEDKKAPVTSPGRGKRQTVVKKGSVINGFTVTEIARDRIILVRGEEHMSVGLMDGEKRKDGTERDKKASLPPTIPPSGPAPPSSSAGTPRIQPTEPLKPAQPPVPSIPRRVTTNDKGVTAPVTASPRK
jgi:hypothetical protein